jgi:predicted unusual protein kinase regulating ubiquinone biosynthesis (AarF/ABC1/UbiB family)
LDFILYKKPFLVEEQNNIPSSKVQRAGRMMKVGIKVGANYMSHYTKKVFTDVDKRDLDRKNAEEIFKVLSQLKGSALKIAQMMSMDQGLIPKAYAEKFIAAQSGAMALSGPLVVNTFKKYTGKMPQDIFDDFNPKSVHAASIGQVHEAHKDGIKLAVKIQYPGVAESIRTDLAMVRPFVLRYFGVSQAAVDRYIREIEDKLVEETDYENELKFGTLIREHCLQMPDIVIPAYYPELSNKRILTMDWADGISLTKFINEEQDQAKRDAIGQALMDFVYTQVHELHYFHADPHPGNFLVTSDNKLVVLDFGCIKELPEDFYKAYFALAIPGIENDKERFQYLLHSLDLIRDNDTPEWRNFFIEQTMKGIDLIARPLQMEVFDFGDKTYLEELIKQGEMLSKDKNFRQPEALRGSQHGIYLHRAFYGAFSILSQLGARVRMRQDFITALA